jgi:hypothetical protein
MPSAATSVRGSVLPPEEQFWQRHSPHNEFPLSSATSIAIHVVALVLLFCLGTFLLNMVPTARTPLLLTPVYVADPGGGGRPLDAGPGPAGDAANRQIEDVDKPKAADANSGKPFDPQRPKLNPLPSIDHPLPNKRQGDQELIENAKKAKEQLSRMSKAARDRLRSGVGTHSPGKDGRPGKDKDKSDADGEGPGPHSGNRRLERIDRWIMLFDTFSGEDYARQLHGLGAILAIPRGGDEYGIIRDLSQRPAKPELGDIGSIHRIYWEDNKRDSVAPLCQALGIHPEPTHVVAFFPKSLEDKLLKIELQYQGLREDQIKQTRFKIRRTASGCEPVVLDQIAK